MFTFARKHTNTTTRERIELVVGFDTECPLAHEHVMPGQSFSLSEAVGADGDALPPLLVGEGACTFVVIPAGADVMEEGPLGARDGAELRDARALRPCSALSNAQMIAVPERGAVWVRSGPLLWRAQRVEVDAPLARTPLTLRQHRWTLASAAFHGSLLASLLFAPPPSTGLCMDALSRDDLRAVRTSLLAAELVSEDLPFADGSAEPAGKDGKRAEGEEGRAGDPSSPKTNNRLSIKHRGTPPAFVASAESVRDAGILGALAKAAAGLAGTSAPYSAATLSGYDADDRMGALFGAQIGENEGFGGLGLKHSGRGGGGDGVGTIGLSHLGTVGAVGRNGDGGIGYGRPGGLGSRDARVPRAISGTADVHGSLSKEAIRRVIQRRLNEVRFCYEQALSSRPDLAGRVQVKFVIAPSGAVQASGVESSTLGSQQAEKCISDAVRRFVFPAPDGGGVVIVSYPFVLQSAS